MQYCLCHDSIMLVAHGNWVVVRRSWGEIDKSDAVNDSSLLNIGLWLTETASSFLHSPTTV